jgi:hypothetical protein
MIYGWKKGKRIPSAAMAWRTGEALARLDRWGSGPMALYAAGYYAETVGMLARLSADQHGAVCAAKLICALPAAVDIPVISSSFAGRGRFGKLVSQAEKLCFEAVSEPVAASLLPTAWETRRLRKIIPATADPAIKFAYTAAKTQVDPAISRAFAWDRLVEWIARFPAGCQILRQHGHLYKQYVNEWRSYALTQALISEPRIRVKTAAEHRAERIRSS